jgi:hypothetical protein
MTMYLIAASCHRMSASSRSCSSTVNVVAAFTTAVQRRRPTTPGGNRAAVASQSSSWFSSSSGAASLKSIDGGAATGGRCFRTQFLPPLRAAETQNDSSASDNNEDTVNISSQQDNEPSPLSSSEQQTTQGSEDLTLAACANQNNRRDQVLSALSEDGFIKVTACTIRNMANDLSLTHSMTEVPTDALGRLVVCSLLMSNGMPAEQTCQLSMDGTYLYTYTIQHIVTQHAIVPYCTRMHGIELHVKMISSNSYLAST